MDIISIIALFGIAMAVVGLLGGIDTEKIKIPKLPNWVRTTLGVSGIALLFLSIYIFPQSPFNPNNVPRLQAVSTESTEIDGNTLTIESIPAEVFVFGGRKEDSYFKKSFCYHSTFRFDDQPVGYRLTYILPKNGDGACGLQFEFEVPQNLKDYSALEFSVEFGTKPVDFEINIRDSDNQWTLFTFSQNNQNAGVTVKSEGKKDRIKISIKDDYSVLKRKFAKALSFAIWTSKTRDSDTMTFSDIKFVK